MQPKLLAQGFLLENPVIDPAIGRGGSAATSLPVFIGNMIRVGFIAGSVVFVFMLIFGAIEYVSAGGEKEKVGNATKRITNALVGIAILFSIFAITALVDTLFSINVLNLILPTF